MGLKQNGSMLDKIAWMMDLPTEALPGQALVEIIGENRVLIENHCGVTKYGETEIAIRVCYGHIFVCGCGLRMAKMTKQQVIICGRIDCISLCRGNGK